MFGFGKKKSVGETTGASHAVVPPIANTSQVSDQNLIQVFDEFGRELRITKEQWREKVLPGTLRSNWNNPEQLYGIIIGSLSDGFFADVLDAAKHLYEIDPVATRGACAYGIVLMKNKRFDEAERVFLAHIREHGEEGVVLTNLAKVYAERNEKQKADDTLWKALALDPNQDNALYWYAGICRERFGEDAWLQAISRVAEIPGSWRPQLWLARAALDSRDLPKALTYYTQSIERAGDKTPTDLLMQLGGDLGQRGFLKESIALAEPRFKPAEHGIAVGNNLIKAHLDLGERDEAQNILDELYALKRPDLKKHLSFWDTEIAKSRVAQSNLRAATRPQISMSSIEGPIWLAPPTPDLDLLRAKPNDAPIVTFLGSTLSGNGMAEKETRQLADAPGRFSRALPLFLGEQVWFNTNAHTTVLTPTIDGEARAFVLSGVPWTEENSAEYAILGERKCDLVVVTDLYCENLQWTVKMRVIRTEDRTVLDQGKAVFSPANPNDAVTLLTRQLLKAVPTVPSYHLHESPAAYRVPSGADFRAYMLRLEQLLATRFAAMGGPQSKFLHGEREIIEGNIQLCLNCPDNIVARVLLARTLKAMKGVRPELIQEFKDKVDLLQTKKPLSESSQTAMKELFKNVFTD